MNWVSEIFFCILTTSATGTVMLAFWCLCRLFLEEWNPNSVYYMIRWIVMLYVLPITCLAMGLSYKSGYVQHGDGFLKMVFVVNTEELIWIVLLVIWFGGMIHSGLDALKGAIGTHLLCKANFEDGESLAQTEFERIKKVLKIKGKVTLLRNDTPGLKSAFAAGVFRRCVVVPYLEYSKKELDVILYHELMHIKKGDILYRRLTLWITIFHGINPFVHQLKAHVREWSELDCDAKTVQELEKHEGIDSKEYYDAIFKFVDGDAKEREQFSLAMLYDEKESLYRRIDFMSKYKKHLNGKKALVATALVMLFAVISTTTAYAAGITVAKVSDHIYKETQVIDNIGLFEENEGWSEEIFIPAEQAKNPNTVYMDDVVMPIGDGTFDWDVPVGTRYVTGYLFMNSGTQVQVACTGTPSDCWYWLGIMHPNNSISIIEGCGAGSRTFTTNSTGLHRVMVENRGDVVLHATGVYTY